MPSRVCSPASLRLPCVCGNRSAGVVAPPVRRVSVAAMPSAVCQQQQHGADKARRDAGGGSLPFSHFGRSIKGKYSRGLFLVFLQQISHGNFKMICYRGEVSVLRPTNSALPVFNRGLVYTNSHCKPVICLAPLRLQTSKVFRKTQTIPLLNLEYSIDKLEYLWYGSFAKNSLRCHCTILPFVAGLDCFLRSQE